MAEDFPSSGGAGVKVNMTVSIPMELSIHDVDITILLGNLLDNAIENFDNESGDVVELDMKYDKGRLFIRLTNPYSGMAQKGEEDFRTRKEDKKNHGFGLQNVHYVVDKYDGEIKIDGCFVLGIILELSFSLSNNLSISSVLSSMPATLSFISYILLVKLAFLVPI